MPAPATITAEGLAELAGNTSRWIRELANRGDIPPGTDGQFPIKESIQAIIRYYKQKQGEKAELATEKIRETKARADLLELEWKKKEGTLVELDLANEFLARVLGPVRQRFVSLPAEMANRTNPSDPQHAREALEEWRDKAMAEIRASIPETVRAMQEAEPPAPKKRSPKTKRKRSRTASKKRS